MWSSYDVIKNGFKDRHCYFASFFSSLSWNIHLIHVFQRAHINSHHFTPSVANQDTLVPRENLSEDKEESDQQEEKEDEEQDE